MNNILEMIKNEKVEWKKLGDVCEILDYKRKPVKKSQRIPGEYPYYGANGIQDYINDYIFDGTFLLMGEDGSVMDEHNRPILHWVSNSKIWVNNHAHVLAEKNKEHNLRYIYYFLSVLDVSDIVNGLPPKINQKNLRQINICFPSLETQERIVKILDTLVGHFTQLEAELEARNKQYEYYRDKLLSEEYLNKLSEKFGGKVEHEELGDVLSYEQPTKYIVKSTQYDDEYTIPVLTAGKSFILGYTNEEDGIYYASKKDPVIIFDDFTSGYHWVEFNFKIKSSAMKMIKPKKDVNFKYCYYYMGKYYTDITDHKRLWISIYSKNIISIPPIPVQEHIVSVLDNFKKIVSDINEGLPKEIELRQKQYEYYRESLLDFKREDE